MKVFVVALLQMTVLVNLATAGAPMYYVLCGIVFGDGIYDRDLPIPAPLYFDDFLDTKPKDGSLTKEEFEDACDGDILDWDQLSKIADKNCDGAISREEFHVIGNMSMDIVALDKDRDFYILKEELGDDETWKTFKDKFKIYLLDHGQEATGVKEYSNFLVRQMSESAVPCACQPAPHIEMLFNVAEGENESDDALDKIVLYRVKVAGRTQYFKGRADDGPKIPVIVG